MSGNVKSVSRKTKNIKDYKSGTASAGISAGSYSSVKQGGKKAVSSTSLSTSAASSPVVKRRPGTKTPLKSQESVPAINDLPELNDAVSDTSIAIPEPKQVPHGKPGVTRTSSRGVVKSRPGSSSGNISMARSTKKVVGRSGYTLPPIEDEQDGASKSKSSGTTTVTKKRPGSKPMQKSIVGSVSDTPKKGLFGAKGDKPEKPEKPAKAPKPAKAAKPAKEPKPAKAAKPAKEPKPAKAPKEPKESKVVAKRPATQKVVAKRPGAAKTVGKKSPDENLQEKKAAPAKVVAKRPGAAKPVGKKGADGNAPKKSAAPAKVVAKKPGAKPVEKKTAAKPVEKKSASGKNVTGKDKVTPISKKRKESLTTGSSEVKEAKGIAASISENASTYRGLGILIFCIAIFAGALVLYAGKEDYFTLNAVMLFVTMLATVLASFSFAPIAIALAAISSIALLVYKVYQLIVEQINLFDLTLLWVIVPAMAVAGMYLFMYVTKRQELDNAVLKNQVSELIMIDPTTGLYNLRSMYMDMQTQISFSVRNETPISLMIIKLRYPKEMKKILSPAQYEKVIARLSEFVVDSVRLEDRVYSLTSDGKFAILLTCDKEGTKLVENRIRAKINGNDNGMSAIASRPLRVEVKIGYEQFDIDRYNRDANSFLEDVEGEADFDMTLLEAGEWA